MSVVRVPITRMTEILVTIQTGGKIAPLHFLVVFAFYLRLLALTRSMTCSLCPSKNSQETPQRRRQLEDGHRTWLIASKRSSIGNAAAYKAEKQLWQHMCTNWWADMCTIKSSPRPRNCYLHCWRASRVMAAKRKHALRFEVRLIRLFSAAQD